MVQVGDCPNITFMDPSSSCVWPDHARFFFTGNRHFLDIVMEPQPSLASGKIKNQNISAWAGILIIKLVLFRVCSAAAAQPASASNWQVSTYSSSASLANLIWLKMRHSLIAELGLLICEWMLSKLVGHKMLTLLTWSLDLMYVHVSSNLTILNRLRLRPPHPAMDQLVQDFNTALDETAGSGSARWVFFTRFWNTPWRKKKDFVIYFFSVLGLIYILFWDLTKLRAFTSFFEGLEFQEEKPGRGVASRPAIW